MRKIISAMFLSFIFAIIFSSHSLAQSKTKIKLPVFMAGENQTVDKPLDRDLMISGSNVKITSAVNGDVYVAGGQLDISGPIKGNLIIAGGNITISGKVSKNVLAAGGQVIIAPTAEIAGYVLAAGGSVDLSGKFLGPVKVGAGSLTVGDKASILGDLEADVSKSEIAATSKISGEKRIKIYETKEPKKQVSQWQQLGLVKEFFSFLSKLIVLLVFVKLFGPKLKELDLKKSFWSTTGLGLVILIVTPVLALILLCTFIAAPLSFITFSFYFTALYLSSIVVSLPVGGLVLKSSNLYLKGLLGLLLITLLGIIPFAGGVFKFIVLLFGLGTIFKKLQIHFST